MAANTSTVTIAMKLSDKGVVTGLKQVENQSGKVDDSLKRVGITGRQSMNALEKNIDSARRKFSNMEATILTVSAAMVAAASVEMFRSIERQGREFESTMKSVAAVSRATAEEYEQLEATARQMGATTEWSAQQSGEALKYMAMAGMSTQESIKGLPGLLDLATAAQMDLATASDIATDTLTAFGMSTNELSRLNDALINTSTRANTTVSMLGESFKYVAPIAANMGLSVEDTAGYLGVMANAGIKASDAGTDLRQVLLRTSKAAKELGMDAGSSLIEVLKEMHTRQLSANEVTELFGMIASKSAMVLMNNVDTVDDLTRAIYENEGATQNIAATMRDTRENALKTFQSALFDIALEMNEAFGPDVRTLLEEMTEAAQNMTPMFKDLGVAIGTVISGMARMVDLFDKFMNYKGQLGDWLPSLTELIGKVAQFVADPNQIAFESALEASKKALEAYENEWNLLFAQAEEMLKIPDDQLDTEQQNALIKRLETLTDLIEKEREYQKELETRIDKQQGYPTIQITPLPTDGGYDDDWGAWSDGLDDVHESAGRASNKVKELSESAIKANLDLSGFESGLVSSIAEHERVIEQFTDTHKRVTMTTYEYELDALNAQFDIFDEHVQDKVALWEWYNKEVEKLTEKRIEAEARKVNSALDDFFGDLDELEKKHRDHTDAVDDLWQHMTENIQDDFSEAIYGMLDGQLDSWGDFFDSILDMFKKMIAEMVAYDLAGMVFENTGDGVGLFTGGSSGSGIIGSIFGGGSSDGSSLSWLSSIGSLFGGEGGGIWETISGIFGSGSGSGSGWLSGILGNSANYAGYIGAFATFMHYMSGVNADSGRNLVNGVAIGDAFSGSIFNDPLMEYVSGDLYGNDSTHSALAYLDAAIASKDAAEAFKTGNIALLEVAALDPLTNAWLGNPIASAFGLEKDPFLRVQTTSTSAELSNSDYQWAAGEGVSPAGFDYNLTLQDIGDESRQALFDAVTGLLDAQFTLIEDTLDVSVNEAIVTAQNRYGAYGGGFFDLTMLEDYGDDIEQALMDMSEGLFLDIQGDLVNQLKDASGSALSSEIFTDEFFENIAVDGEAAVDTFLRFAQTIQETDGFMEAFTRQTDEFGVSADQAYQNVLTLKAVTDEIMTGLDDNFKKLSESSVIESLEETILSYDGLIATLEAAGASAEDLAKAETYRRQELGAAVTGLTADSVASGLWSAIQNNQSAGQFVQSLESQIRSGAAQAIVNAFSESIYSAFIAPINEQMGAAVQSMVSDIIAGGTITSATLQSGIEAITAGIDATIEMLNNPGLIAKIEELMDSVSEMTSSLSETSGSSQSSSSSASRGYTPSYTTTTSTAKSAAEVNAYYNSEAYAAKIKYHEDVAAFNEELSKGFSTGEITDYAAALSDLESRYEALEATATSLGISTSQLNEMYEAEKQRLTDIINFNTSLDDIIAEHTLSDYEYELQNLNQWQSEQIAEAEQLGLSTDKVTKAYNLQVQALKEKYDIEKDMQAEIDDLNASYQDIIDNHTLSDYDELNAWKAEEAAKLDALGASHDKLNQAYELQKQTLDDGLIAKAKEIADVFNAAIDPLNTYQSAQQQLIDKYTDIVVTMYEHGTIFDEHGNYTEAAAVALSAFNTEMKNLRDNLLTDITAIQATITGTETVNSIDGLSGILGFDASVFSTESGRQSSLDLIAGISTGDIADYLDSVNANPDDLNSLVTLLLGQQRGISDILDPLKSDLESSGLEGVDLERFNISRQADDYREALTTLGASLESLSIVDQWETDQLSQLADEAEEAGEEIEDLTDQINDFNRQISDIIAQHTMSDLGYELYQLDQWYVEQKATAEELGISLEKLNHAYELQVEAAHKANVETTRAAYRSAVADKLSQAQVKQTELETAFSDAKSTYIAVLQDEISKQQEAASAAESASNQFESLAETLKDASDSLARSELSGGSPDQIYRESRSQLDSLMQDIWSGDEERMAIAMSDLPGISTDFLDASKNQTANYEEYIRDVAKVQSYLNTAQGIAENRKSTEELTLEQNTAQTEHLQAILDGLLDDQLPSLADAESNYFDAKERLDESHYEDQIDHYQAELDRLDLIITGNTNIETALGTYQDALTSAISAGYNSFSSELAALKNSRSDSANASTSSSTSAVTDSAAISSSVADSSERTVKILKETDTGVMFSIWEGDKQISSVGASTAARSFVGNIEEKYGVDVPGYGYGFADGGTVSGPTSGYHLPTTFHGVEHITPDSQMKGVKEELAELKKLFNMMLNTMGMVNGSTQDMATALKTSSREQKPLLVKVAA